MDKNNTDKVYFLDACAIVEYYQPQTQNNAIEQLIQKNPKCCFVSEWGIIETASALRIRYTQEIEKQNGQKNKQTLKDHYQIVLQKIANDVQNHVFITEKLPRDYWAKAVYLIHEAFLLNRSLKPGDAMQLVSFIEVHTRMPQAILVSNDDKLCKFAQAKNYTVQNY